MHFQPKTVEVFEHKIGSCFHIFSCLEGKLSIINIKHAKKFEEGSVGESICRVAGDSY